MPRGRLIREELRAPPGCSASGRRPIRVNSLRESPEPGRQPPGPARTGSTDRNL